jgi:hypothetical protein
MRAEVSEGRATLNVLTTEAGVGATPVELAMGVAPATAKAAEAEVRTKAMKRAENIFFK